MSEKRFDVVVVGAGFAGMYMLLRARSLGFRVRVLEAGSGVGGVWFHNRYPGARCDVESVDYSYSFDEDLQQEWSWTERYAAQPEILRYAEHVADRFDLRRDIEFGVRVEQLELDEATDRWTVRTDGDTYDAQHVVMATGGLSIPRWPDYEGLDEFEGEWHHTAQWPHEEVAVEGRRIGVLGTGSSGTQVVPVVAREGAAHVTVFQRTPNFTIPAQHEPMDPAFEAEVKADYAGRRAAARETTSGLIRDTSKTAAMEVSPEERERVFEEAWKTAGFGFILCFSDLLIDREANDAAVDFISRKVREAVADQELATHLIPTNHPYGTKRPCVASDWYQVFNRDNVSLVDVRDTPIERITPKGVLTADGVEHELDLLVIATGFHAVTGALEQVDIRGRDGRTLKEAWAAGPRTYLGISVAGFPNLFTITGPGSPGLLSNVMAAIEQHVDWLTDLLVHAREAGVTSIEASEEAQDAWVDHVNAMADATLYPEADSYYLTAPEGGPRVFKPYPGGLRRYRYKAAKVAENGYEGFELKGAPAVA